MVAREDRALLSSRTHKTLDTPIPYGKLIRHSDTEDDDLNIARTERIRSRRPGGLATLSPQ